ncbi:MAG TPA: leucine--tRNA ligase [Patescibacteria group bacterium]|nr:leucine--tRNA ligase [Patescibacteria group bacterium]
MKPYDPKVIEAKWVKKWREDKLFQGTAVKKATDKLYILYAFAYPSGSGLHVGHVEPTTALDMYARYSRMAGKDVFFPVGWDAFGLPAENYAIKTGIHPAKTTKDAIHAFEKQIERVGISYDWETEIATCHPGYYKWTQWIFTQLFKAGLAYRDKGWVNWCPADKTVLANEQVVEGKCERCGTAVIQKELEQWKFKITAYQDELLDDLDQVNWPNSTKLQQKNWIGRSEGAEVSFQLSVISSEQILKCFTTRLDTIEGVTFVVIAPEKFREMGLMDNVGASFMTPVQEYLDAASHKTEEQRRVGEKEKTGVDTGLTLIHPLTGEEVPLWIADYVLSGFGTGVVMGVPSLDERDSAFAKKFGLPIKEISLDKTVGQLLKEHPEVFSKKTNYKLRDWLISRQRYWGAPIPMTFCNKCGWQAVPDKDLPVLLPELEDFKPTDDGRSPLEKASEEWKYTICPECGGKAKREVDTMDTFVDSSWYFLRYTDARNETEFASKEQMKKWLPVDTYLIGPEHIVLHLLYARFFTKFLRDQGYLDFDEPFMKMRHQGMILGPDGKKMSKSKGNVINPDEIIEKFGADTLRVYEMFMGPLDADKAWDMGSVAGVYRFLSRIYSLFQTNAKGDLGNKGDKGLTKKLHKTIKKLTEDLPQMRFNTAIAALMELVNVWSESSAQHAGFTPEELEIVAKLLAPFAPYLAEEMHRGNTGDEGDKGSIHEQKWPEYDPILIEDEEVEYAVQVNGKVKGRFTIASSAHKDEIQEKALTFISGKPKKIIVVPRRLVNIVV